MVPMPASSYVSLDVGARLRTQAFRVWLAGLAVTAFWVVLIVGAPLAKAGGLISISSPLYHFFSFICHQIPERSLHIEGEQLAVCSRCFGVYFGLVLGFAVYPIWRNITEIEPLPRIWLFLS